MRGILSGLACVLLSGCQSGEAPISIENAWSPPTPPGAFAAAVYMHVTARDADVLLSASTPIAQHAEMHTTTDVDGMMQMRPIERAPLAAGETVRFEPGGRHFMLMNLRATPGAGSEFPVTLRLERAGEITVNVRVRARDEDQG